MWPDAMRMKEMKVARSVPAIPVPTLSICFGLITLSACSTAASVGDETLRRASLGRIQASPFTDIVETQNCRDTLDAAYGFTRESRAMKNGVFVVQTYDCQANRIVASVSLNNYTADPVYCFAETEDGIDGVSVAPKAIGYFEYSYTVQAYQACETIR